jgi:hypothetical protein
MGDLSIKVRKLIGSFIWLMVLLGINEMILVPERFTMRLLYKEFSNQCHF